VALSEVTIDGSYGEGGGQILRTAVALSAIIGRPVKVVKIRAGRPNPGLRPQHVGAIRIIASMCDAEVDGLAVGSEVIVFKPKNLVAKSVRYDVGSAGAITLLLQVAVIVAAKVGQRCSFEIVGGTDVKWSPTIDYFNQVYVKALRALGIDVKLNVERRGYYPKGGGLVKVEVEPAKDINSITLLEYTPIPANIISVCSQLPFEVARRQVNTALSTLQRHKVQIGEVRSTLEQSSSAGTSITIYGVDEDKGIYVGADAVGERGKPAEIVGKEAAEKFLVEWSANAPVDSHLADMLVLPLCLADGVSIYKTPKLTQHLETNLYVVSRITDCTYELKRHSSGAVEVKILPKMYWRAV
ncbi:MAG: RNA 3'-terminal phosphate cyclase, partial [Nitrososphaerales archaeon]